MLKRHLLTAGLALMMVISATFSHNIPPAPRQLIVTTATTVKVDPHFPRLSKRYPGHSDRWYAALAAYIKAIEEAEAHALLAAWYAAISTPYHTGTYNGYACGGDLPSCCTVAIESHGNPYAVEPGHLGAPYGDPGDPWDHASGLDQFMPQTWGDFHGYPYAAAAPVHDQYLREAEVFNHGLGAYHWYGDGCYPGG